MRQMTDEEHRQYIESALRRIDEIERIPDNPSDPPEDEWMRGIDALRPHRSLFKDYDQRWPPRPLVRCKIVDDRCLNCAFQLAHRPPLAKKDAQRNRKASWNGGALDVIGHERTAAKCAMHLVLPMNPLGRVTPIRSR
jgi:hypothetical protein